MAATRGTIQARESASRARHETPVEETGAEADAGVLQTMSRMIYSGSFALTYGVVYATVFVAQMIPQDNSMMYGFQDGGKAAMDELNRS